MEDAAPRGLTMDEVHASLRELVTAHLYSIAQAFTSIDYAGLGVVAKQDFRDILNRHVMRLSEEQVKQWTVTVTISLYVATSLGDIKQFLASSISQHLQL